MDAKHIFFSVAIAALLLSSLSTAFSAPSLEPQPGQTSYAPTLGGPSTGDNGEELPQSPNVDELKDAVDALLDTPLAPGAKLDSEAPFRLAQFEPEAAADFLHQKLMAYGMAQKAAPAPDPGAWRQVYGVSPISSCLKALAWCDTKKSREHLLNLLDRAQKPEGLFLGQNTEEAIYQAFAWLHPAYVNDELVDKVINHIKDVDIRRNGNRPDIMLGDIAPFPGNPVVITGFQTLAVFAQYNNAKALNYLKTQAKNAADERRARAAMYALSIIRKPEIAAIYRETASGKFPEENRRLAVVCLGLIGMPNTENAAAPAYKSAGWQLPTLPQNMQYRATRATASTYSYSFPAYSPETTLALAPTPKDKQPPAKLVYPPEEVSNTCAKGLAEAFEFNNSVALRAEVILSLGCIGRNFSRAPLLDIAAKAIDEDNREMALIALRISLSPFPEGAQAVKALTDIMNTDASSRVRVQAAYTLSGIKTKQPGSAGLQYYTSNIVYREQIPTFIEGLKACDATVTGSGMYGGTYIAMDIPAFQALNAIRAATFHGDTLAGNADNALFQKSLAEFIKWWDANKDKTDQQWAMQGLADWVSDARESIKRDSEGKTPYLPVNAAVAPFVRLFLEKYAGLSAPPARSGYPAGYATPLGINEIKTFCDLYDKNKDKITWNPEKRCFELPLPKVKDAKE